MKKVAFLNDAFVPSEQMYPHRIGKREMSLKKSLSCTLLEVLLKHALPNRILRPHIGFLAMLRLLFKRERSIQVDRQAAIKNLRGICSNGSVR